MRYIWCLYGTDNTSDELVLPLKIYNHLNWSKDRYEHFNVRFKNIKNMKFVERIVLN